MTSDFSEEKLGNWIQVNLPDFGTMTGLKKFPGGQSNPTYRVTTTAGDLVLRRKPFGDLLPSAHAVHREHRLIAALHPVGFPVPKPVALCRDEAVIGAEFYLMEAIDGRTYWDGMLPEQNPTERRAIYEAAITTLATLHSIEPEAVGLGDFRRAGNYFGRQVDRWTKQYRAAQTETIESVEKLIEWLPRTLPEQGRTSIVHGDFRIDNMLLARKSTSVLAVIDWELSTIGDPLADLSYFAMAWTMSSDGHSWIGDADFATSGIPSLEEIVGMYCEKTRRAEIPGLHWYFAFNMFRLVGIMQGVKRRMLDGNASSANAEDAVARLKPLAEEAWAQARRAGAR